MTQTGSARFEGDSWDLASSVGLTATMVAAARAVAGRAPGALVNDQFAEPLVRAVGVDFFVRMASGELDPDELAEDEANGLRRFADAMAIRTHYFDNFFLDATRAGIRQAVILASGLDSRAYRLRWPAGTIVFEVDQPQVIDFKTTTLAGLGAAPTTDRRTVAVDLRDDWPTALQKAGFDNAQRTAWIAEGLLGYLSAEAQDRLLDQITAQSVPGSQFATEVLRDINRLNEEELRGRMRRLAERFRRTSWDPAAALAPRIRRRSAWRPPARPNRMLPAGTSRLGGLGRGRAGDHRHGRERPGHLRARLAQCRGSVTLFSMIGVNPDPDVHLAVDKLAEHHPDLDAGINSHEPSRLLVVDALLCGSDLVVDAAGGSPGSIAGGAHFFGSSSEDVAVLIWGERPQLQALTRAGWTLLDGEAQLFVQVVELGDDLCARILGELIERHAHHRFGGQVRGAQQVHDRLDGGGLVGGLHDGVCDLMPTFQRGEQGIGDLSTGRGLVVICHCISVERHTSSCAMHLGPPSGQLRAAERQEPAIAFLGRPRPVGTGFDNAVG